MTLLKPTLLKFETARLAIFSIFTALFLSFASIATGAGVTLITHGLNGSADGWVTGMAEQIPNYPTFPGTTFTFYKLYFIPVVGGQQLTWARLGGSQPSSTDSGEIIIALDWSQLADGDSFNTYQVAAPVASALQNPNFIPELNDHALGELPLNLIGHSRGGSLISEVSRILGTNGLWVDHMTTLDPHPLNDPAFPLDSFLYSAVDAPARTYQNVLFHDNYWQNLSFIGGQAVAGAYVRKLVDLRGGYPSSISSDHSNVHLWYHGTLDQRNPANDSEARITSAEFNDWYVPYEQASHQAGFFYSSIGGGDRASANQPVGTGYPAIRDGYNQVWDFGAGQSANRTSLPSNNGNWANVIKFNLMSGNEARQGTNIAIKYFYQWARPNGNQATVSFFLDDDFNPLNSNSNFLQQVIVPGNGAGFVSSQTLNLELNSTNAPVGLHALYAKITAAGRTRYLYAPEILSVEAPLDSEPPTIAITNPPNATIFTNAQTATLLATATDNVGVTNVEFYDGAIFKGNDATAPYNFDWSFNVADNGAHDWTARAYDAAGNFSTSSVVTLIVSVDLTPPTIAISAPTNGQVSTVSSFIVSGTAADDGVATSGISVAEIRVNGGNWITAIGTTNWSQTVSLSPCANIIEARSLDLAGNYSAIDLKSAIYIPPNTAPIPPVNIAPANGSTAASLTPTLQATPFSDADCIGDTHAATEWQVLTRDGNVVVAGSGADSVNLVSWIVPSNKLSYGSNYVWRVRYLDSRNAWSSNSTPTMFSTIAPPLTGTKQSDNIILSWPTNAPGFTLQWSTNLATTNWNNETSAPVIASGQFTVTNKITNAVRLYRLRRP